MISISAPSRFLHHYYYISWGGGADCWFSSFLSLSVSPRRWDPRCSYLFCRHLSPWSLVVLSSFFLVCSLAGLISLWPIIAYVLFVPSHHMPITFQSFLCYIFRCVCYICCTHNTFIWGLSELRMDELMGNRSIICLQVPFSKTPLLWEVYHRSTRYCFSFQYTLLK